MFFTILVVTLLALLCLAAAARRPSWASRRDEVRIAAVIVLVCATIAAFRTDQSPLFSWGLVVVTLASAAFVAGGHLGARREQPQP
jgi:hypothetical protein